jgi:hypothetical protein
VQEFPMMVSRSGSKLITYEIMVINQRIIYVLCEDDFFGMVYHYDLVSKEVLGVWAYQNELCKNSPYKFFPYVF